MTSWIYRQACAKAIKALPAAAVAAVLSVVSGCARPYGVPGFSQLVAEAPGQSATFQAPDDGSVYVDGPGRPGQPRHIVYSGLIRRGEILTVDPSSQQLLVNGKAQNVTIEGGPKSYYQVWYQQANYEWY
ncbi:MAG TPA: hypothetical protein VLJ39_05500 [Tepidisphaeraceae bacterium]|jgi:hypothetical protein|nr:hypothetical protein [Tepidisphaeraceae bacterium]